MITLSVQGDLEIELSELTYGMTEAKILKGLETGEYILSLGNKRIYGFSGGLLEDLACFTLLDSSFDIQTYDMEVNP